ncbi:TA system antitoxin ParD family protein [Caenispirillum bisanense]|uniref:TA system antitoxin ParD family protein n=1 Tax=Caenispirillum bisanense TaxID=414052 RepID=UPI0031D727C2
MPTALKLSTDLVDAARPHAAALHRSVSKQIEHWARLGKAAEENPDLPGSFIQDILLAKEEEKAGLAEPYSLDE